MIRRALASVALLLFAGACLDMPLFAQTNPPDPVQQANEAARAAERARAAEDAAREATRRQQQLVDQKMREFLTDNRELLDKAANGTETRRQMLRRAEYTRMKDAFRRFENSREQLAGALGFKAKLKDPAKEIEKSAGVFLDFIKQRSNKRARFEAGEFKDFTASELGWEALATAERVAPQLSAILKSEEDAIVDINFLMSLSKVEAELLRLQWMTKRLK